MAQKRGMQILAKKIFTTSVKSFFVARLFKKKQVFGGRLKCELSYLSANVG
jgi:hypothetical protein